MISYTLGKIQVACPIIPFKVVYRIFSTLHQSLVNPGSKVYYFAFASCVGGVGAGGGGGVRLRTCIFFWRGEGCFILFFSLFCGGKKS